MWCFESRSPKAVSSHSRIRRSQGVCTCTHHSIVVHRHNLVFFACTIIFKIAKNPQRHYIRKLLWTAQCTAQRPRFVQAPESCSTATASYTTFLFFLLCRLSDISYSTVVQHDLRTEESLMQLFDALEYLDGVVHDVFGKIEAKVNNNFEPTRHPTQSIYLSSSHI